MEGLDLSDLSQKLHVTIPPFLKCPVCLDVLSDPRMLPCTHTICSGCLDNMARFSQVRPANNRTGKVVRCPECRTAITVTADEEPPLNRGLAAAVSDWKTRVSKERLEWFLTQITTCIHHHEEGVTADIWCSTCQHNICNFCTMDDGHRQHTLEDIPNFESFSAHRAEVLCQAFETHERLSEVTSRVQKIQNLEAAVTDAHLVWKKSVDSQEERAHQLVSTKFKAIRNLGDNMTRQELESIHREGLAGLQTLNLIGSCFDAVPRVMQCKDPCPDNDIPILELVSTVESYLTVTHDRSRMKIQDFVRSINAPLSSLCEVVDRFASGNNTSDNGRPFTGRWQRQGPGYRGRSHSRGHSPHSRQRQNNIIRIVPRSAPAPNVAAMQPMQQDHAQDLSVRPRTRNEVQNTANPETTSIQTVASSSLPPWPTRNQTQRFWGESTSQEQDGLPNSTREQESQSAEEDAVSAAGPSAEDAIQSSIRLIISNIANSTQQIMSNPATMSQEPESSLLPPPVAPNRESVNDAQGAHEEALPLTNNQSGPPSAAVGIISPSMSTPHVDRDSTRNEDNSAASSAFLSSETAYDRTRVAALQHLDMPSDIALSGGSHQSDSTDFSTDTESPVNRNLNNSHGAFLQEGTKAPLVLSGCNSRYVNASSMYHVRPDTNGTENADSWSSPEENMPFYPSQLYSPLGSDLLNQRSSMTITQQSQVHENHEVAATLAAILDTVDILYGMNESQLTFHGSHDIHGSTHEDAQPQPSTSGQPRADGTSMVLRRRRQY